MKIKWREDSQGQKMIDANVLENPPQNQRITVCCIKVRSWKIRLCQEILTPYPTHDDPKTASHLVVLWRIPDFIRNLRWGGLSTWMAGLGQIHISMYRNTDTTCSQQTLPKIINNHKCSSTFGTILPCTLLLYAHYLVQTRNDKYLKGSLSLLQVRSLKKKLLL